MSQCLSQAEIAGYLRGAVNDQQRSAFDEHVSSCPGCKTRIEAARESSLDLRPGASRQGATQIEVTSAMEVASRSGPDSHWTDGDVAASQMVVASPAPAPKVSLDDFLTGLSQSGLLPASDVASARDRSHKDPTTSTVAGLIEWLVQEHKLTRYQANILARGQSGGLVLGNYVILDKLGQGGMGTVFKARHRRMNRLVALKVLPQSLSSLPEAIARFQREVEAAARLQHPNIAAAYDADEASGVHFLVMEYVDGPTLANYIKQRGPLPTTIAVRLAAQAARGLAAAHAQGIVHRDIKPSNIMLSRQGVLKVLDMGLAQVRGPETLELTSDVTQTGRVMGTVDYMAPEQARDAKNVDLRADIYRLGCTLYYLATGQTPAPGGSAAEKLLWHQAAIPLALSAAGVSSTPRLDDIVLRMMAKKVEDRPLSMHDVAEELERCVPDLPTADSALLLDGMDLVTEHGASTLYGSNYGQATMHNLGDTLVSKAGRPVTKPSGPASPQSRTWLYAGGLAVTALVAAVIAAPFFMNKPEPAPQPADKSTLFVRVDGEPAEVHVDGVLLGRTTGNGQELQLNVEPGERTVQIRRSGFEDYERRVKVGADEPFRLAAMLKKVGVAPATPVSIHAPYEKVLNWVFNNRGQVTATSGVGQKYQLTALSQLPAVPLEIQAIKLDGSGVRDADLAALADVPDILDLSLANTPITDAGLVHLEKLRRLQRLNLSKTGVKSAGLEAVKRLSALVELNLDGTEIDDQGLRKLSSMPRLERLFLTDTPIITDLGIAPLKSLKSLKLLTLNGTSLSDALHKDLSAALPDLEIAWDGADVERGVAQRLLGKGATLAILDRAGQLQKGIASVESLPSGRVTIKEADLSTARGINDDDVKQLQNLSAVESLSLAGASLKPDGLAPLFGLQSLRKLDLGTLNLQPQMVTQLKQTLKNCNVVIREPADVEFAKQILTAGGAINIQLAEQGTVYNDVRDPARLPAARFLLRGIKLDELPAVNDALFGRLGELPSLELLSLRGTAITDDGLAKISACRSLKDLTLSGTKITADGLAHLVPLTKLAQLYLAETQIGGAGVRRLGELPSLTDLSLQGVKLTDGDLTQLKRLDKLKFLDLSNTPITDAALEPLSGLPSLTSLRIVQTDVTDAGWEEFKSRLTGCNVQGDPLDPQRLAAKWFVERKGTVILAGPTSDEVIKVATLKDVPREPCRILSIDLANSTLGRTELAPRLASCPTVASLNLSSTSLLEADLGFLRAMTGLKDLRLAGLGVSDQTLTLLSGQATLEYLDLSGNSRLTGAGLDKLSAVGLKHLLLSNTRFEERYLPALEKFPDLETLDLSTAGKVTDAGLESIVKLKKLRTLLLRNAKFSEAGAEKLADLTELDRLDLDGTLIGDSGVAKLAALKKLRIIGLASTPVTDGVVGTLREMKQLVSINLVKTGVTPASAQDLRTALPGSSVSISAPPPRDPNAPLGGASGASAEQPQTEIRVGRVP